MLTIYFLEQSTQKQNRSITRKETEWDEIVLSTDGWFFSLVWWRQSIKMPQASRSSLRHNGILHILNNSSLPKLISWNSITHITMIMSGYFGTCLDIVESLWVVLVTLRKRSLKPSLPLLPYEDAVGRYHLWCRKQTVSREKILAHVPWPLRLWIMYFCYLWLPTLRQIKWHIT